ncbi:hypothetical protein BKI52_22740 [marine bacterium AO1-C]|nr:hypothetical protein BKI52_22740 [marine bacterium AO1-C]
MPSDPAKAAHTKVLVLIHGRGDTSEKILKVFERLNLPDFACVAPQAENNAWYPKGFMAPMAENQPFLDNGLALVKELHGYLSAAGVQAHHLYFAGFSQGACLAVDYAARHAQHYGGVIAFSGGLIGDTLEKNRYSGDFAGTPIYLGASKTDSWVPASRIDESEEWLNSMNAQVDKHYFEDNDHTIRDEEIDMARRLLAG